MNKYTISIGILVALFISLTLGTCTAQVVKTQEWQFDNTVTLNSNLIIPSFAGSGKVLTSDGSGTATWQTPGTGAILVAQVTLSSADILSLHTTPVTIVAAQGPNTVIVPLRVIEYMDYNTTTYATDGTLQLLVGAQVVSSNAAYLFNASDVLANLTISNYSSSGSISAINGALTVTTQTTNPTAGDSPVKIRVLYSVINL